MFYMLPRFCQNGFVRVIRLKVSDLYDFEGRKPDANPDSDAIAAIAAAVALKHESRNTQLL